MWHLFFIFFLSEADEMLKRLETERNLIEARQILPLEHDIFGEEDRKEILEYVDEDELEKWRSKEYIKEFFNNNLHINVPIKTKIVYIFSAT